MVKEMGQALESKGYTANEIKLLLESLSELLDKLRMEASWKRFSYRSTIHRRIHRRS